jgi:hypothetical protein
VYLGELLLVEIHKRASKKNWLQEHKKVPIFPNIQKATDALKKKRLRQRSI